jgi:hypothetical protein
MVAVQVLIFGPGQANAQMPEYLFFASDVHYSDSTTNKTTQLDRLGQVAGWAQTSSVAQVIGCTMAAFVGDHNTESANGATLENLAATVKAKFTGITNNDHVIFTQGNHDGVGDGTGNYKVKPSGPITSLSSLYDVFVINYIDFCSQESALRNHLTSSASAGKVQIILTHYPLHSMEGRVSCSTQGIFNVLQEQGKSRDIVVLWGHDHKHANSDKNIRMAVTPGERMLEPNINKDAVSTADINADMATTYLTFAYVNAGYILPAENATPAASDPSGTVVGIDSSHVQIDRTGYLPGSASYMRHGFQLQSGQGGKIAAARNKDGTLEVFYIKNTDNQIYHRRQNLSNTWGSESSLGVQASQLAVASNLNGQLELVWSRYSDGKLYHRRQSNDAGTWNTGMETNAEFLNAKATQLAVGQNRDGRLDVFYVNPDSNNSIWHLRQLSTANTTGWESATSLGGNADAGHKITIAQNSDRRLELFYVGPGEGQWGATDHYIYHMYQDTKTFAWVGQAYLEGMAFQIALGQNKDGRLEEFHVGTNQSIYHNWQIFEFPHWGWLGEYSMQGTALQLGVAQNYSDGCLEEFHIGTSNYNYIFHNRQTGSTCIPWQGEDYLDTNEGTRKKAEELTVGQNRDGSLEVFFIGADDKKIYHNKQSAGIWQGDSLL